MSGAFLKHLHLFVQPKDQSHPQLQFNKRKKDKTSDTACSLPPWLLVCALIYVSLSCKGLRRLPVFVNLLTWITQRYMWKSPSPPAFPLELSAFTFHLRHAYLICKFYTASSNISHTTTVYVSPVLFLHNTPFRRKAWCSFALCKSTDIWPPCELKTSQQAHLWSTFGTLALLFTKDFYLHLLL